MKNPEYTLSNYTGLTRWQLKPITAPWILFVLLLSCDHHPELSINPLEPNYHATMDDLTRWNFKERSLDDGICVYQKTLTKSSSIFFYLSFDDGCVNTTQQGFTVTLDTLHNDVSPEDFTDENHGNWYRLNLVEFKKDSLQIEKIVKTYGGVIASPASRLGNSQILVFSIKNIASGKSFECDYYAFPQKQKCITLYATWK